jgi:thiol-disulfide isomerase/thioredoxin
MFQCGAVKILLSLLLLLSAHCLRPAHLPLPLRSSALCRNANDEFDFIEIVSPDTSKSTNSISTKIEKSKKINQLFASISIALGIGLGVYQSNTAVSGLTILKTMEKDSIALGDAICNRKPTIIEFYADWCESCKKLAPSMRAMELKYGDKVNFITLDGMQLKNGEFPQTNIIHTI